MKFDLVPYGRPFHLLVGLESTRPVHLRLCVFDSETKRIFSERDIKLDRTGNVLLKMPIVPDRLTVEIVDMDLPRFAPAFRISDIKVLRDKKCPIELTEEDKKFIRLVKWFACECAGLKLGKDGVICQDSGFSILYRDKIVDEDEEQTTPARIDKVTGLIHVSRKRTIDYTVLMLMVILLHEYAHFYKNKQYGKTDSNELAADLIACHIALNLGFDSYEVRRAFEEVFRRKQTDLNKRRMSAINEFIDIFEKNESERCKTNAA